MNINENDYILPNNASMTCDQDASDYLGNKELDECLLQFGSFLSIIQVKKVNYTNYLLILVENEQIREILLEMTGIDTFEELVREMIIRYPILCKSKVISSRIKKWKKTTKH